MAKHTIGEELKAVLVFVGCIWLVFIIEYIPGLNLTNYGIVPRTAQGLIGILTAPFLHANLAHITGNTVPLIVLLVLLAGSRATSWAIVLSIIVLSGALLWLFGRTANHIGASGLIYGLVAYLFISGIREQRFVPMAIAILVGFLYGSTMAYGLLPGWRSIVSWDGHLFGAIAGGAVAYWTTRHSDADAGRPRVTCREI
jgi:membrane associated rhomboid family serine protease